MTPRAPKTSLLRNRDEDGRYKKPTAQEQMLIDMLTVYYNDPRMGGDLPHGVDNREAIRKDAWSLAECVYYKLSNESDPCSIDSLEIITNAVCGRFGIPVDDPAKPRGRSRNPESSSTDLYWDACLAARNELYRAQQRLRSAQQRYRDAYDAVRMIPKSRIIRGSNRMLDIYLPSSELPAAQEAYRQSGLEADEAARAVTEAERAAKEAERVAVDAEKRLRGIEHPRGLDAAFFIHAASERADLPRRAAAEAAAERAREERYAAEQPVLLQRLEEQRARLEERARGGR